MEPVSESGTIKEHQTNRANFIERSAEGQKCVRTDASQQYHYFCHAEKKKVSKPKPLPGLFSSKWIRAKKCFEQLNFRLNRGKLLDVSKQP